MEFLATSGGTTAWRILPADRAWTTRRPSLSRDQQQISSPFRFTSSFRSSVLGVLRPIHGISDRVAAFCGARRVEELKVTFTGTTEVIGVDMRNPGCHPWLTPQLDELEASRGGTECPIPLRRNREGDVECPPVQFGGSDGRHRVSTREVERPDLERWRQLCEDLEHESSADPARSRGRPLFSSLSLLGTLWVGSVVQRKRVPKDSALATQRVERVCGAPTSAVTTRLLCTGLLLAHNRSH